MNKKRIVITYGTYDLLHEGHIKLLKRAKSLGDYLIVGLSTDEFNGIKHKDSFLSFEQRKYVLEAIKYVDKVIAENDWEQKTNDIKKFKVDTFVMGDDWKGKFDDLKKLCKVVYLKRTMNVSTTQLKTNIINNVNAKNRKHI